VPHHTKVGYVNDQVWLIASNMCITWTNDHENVINKYMQEWPTIGECLVSPDSTSMSMTMVCEPYIFGQSS
jgi:hypothetical protein